MIMRKNKKKYGYCQILNTFPGMKYVSQALLWSANRHRDRLLIMLICSYIMSNRMLHNACGELLSAQVADHLPYKADSWPTVAEMRAYLAALSNLLMFRLVCESQTAETYSKGGVTKTCYA